MLFRDRTGDKQNKTKLNKTNPDAGKCNSTNGSDATWSSAILFILMHSKIEWMPKIRLWTKSASKVEVLNLSEDKNNMRSLH